MIERPDFTGLIMGIGIWYLFLNNENMQSLELVESIRKFLNVMVAAIVYDSLWLFFHSSVS